MTGPSLSQDNLPLGERLARRWLDDWRGAAALVALLALASSITSITNGFAYDDLPLIVDTDRLKDWRQLWRVFGQSYWASATAPQDLYRPLILVWYGLQWTVGGGTPLLFHAVNIALYVVLSVVLLTLLRRIMTVRSAAVGVSVWAVHPVHVEAVGNVVGQAELLSALVILIGLWVYERARTSTGLTRNGAIALAILYAMALLTKEHAIVFPALLGALEAVLHVRGIPWRRSESSARWLLVRLLLYVVVLYLFTRWAVLPSLSSVPHFALARLSHGERVLAAMGWWPRILVLLVWPADLHADYSPQVLTVHSSPHGIHALSLILVAAWVAGVWYAWRNRRGPLLLGFAWFPLTFALTSNLLFPTGFLIAERTLLLPSVSLAILATWGGRFPTVGRQVRGSIWGMGVATLLLLGVWRSAARQRTWADSMTVFSTMVADAPTNARSLVMLGNLYVQMGASEKAAPYLERAFRLHPATGSSFARYLQRSGRCAEALPVAELVVTKYFATEDVEITRIACLLEVRRFSEARRLTAAGILRGRSNVAFPRLLLAADSLLAASDSIDVRNQWVRAGRPVTRTGDRVAVNLLEMPVAVNPRMFDGGRRPAP